MDITEQNLKTDDILKQIFGYSSYRNGQEEIVKNILDVNKHLQLCLQELVNLFVIKYQQLHQN